MPEAVGHLPSPFSTPEHVAQCPRTDYGKDIMLLYHN